MKIYNKIVYDFDNNIIEEDSYEYEFSMNKKNTTNEISLGLELLTINHQSNRLKDEKYNLNTKSVFAQYDMNILKGMLVKIDKVVSFH